MFSLENGRSIGVCADACRRLPPSRIGATCARRGACAEIPGPYQHEKRTHAPEQHWLLDVQKIPATLQVG